MGREIEDFIIRNTIEDKGLSGFYVKSPFYEDWRWVSLEPKKKVFLMALLYNILTDKRKENPWVFHLSKIRNLLGLFGRTLDPLDLGNIFAINSEDVFYSSLEDWTESWVIQELYKLLDECLEFEIRP